MNPRDWLKIVAASMPGKPSASRTSSLAQYATRLGASAAQEALTPSSAEAVGRSLDGFPTFDDLLSALHAAAPVTSSRGPSRPRELDELEEAVARRRIAEGADVQVVLSLAQRYYSPGVWERLAQDYDPAGYRAEMDARQEIADKRARRVAVPSKRSIAVAPGPTARPVDDQPHVVAPVAAPLPPDVLAAARRAAGIMSR